ncbi:MAG: hypothetical protein HC846_01430 [Blastocatellia bacterium]|nr:hypothetical protein [Blastocatellia bacterium]
MWLVFAIFVACALYFNWHSRLLTYNAPIDVGKYLIWMAFIGFAGYTFYCSSKENLFKTIKKMSEWFWGRQALLDLYIGSLLVVFIIYLHSGSITIALLWLIPCLLFVNLATLLYFAIHYNSIIEKFIS